MAQPRGLTVIHSRTPLQSPPTADNTVSTHRQQSQGIYARANCLLIPFFAVVAVMQMAAPAAAAAAPSLLHELSSSLGKIGLNEDSSAAQRDAVEMARKGTGANPLMHAIKAADARAATAPFDVQFSDDRKQSFMNMSPSAVSEIDKEYDDELNNSEDEEAQAAEAWKAQAAEGWKAHAAAAAEQPAKKKKNDVSSTEHTRANGFRSLLQSAHIARACICCCPHC